MKLSGSCCVRKLASAIASATMPGLRRHSSSRAKSVSFTLQRTVRHYRVPYISSNHKQNPSSLGQFIRVPSATPTIWCATTRPYVAAVSRVTLHVCVGGALSSTSSASAHSLLASSHTTLRGGLCCPRIGLSGRLWRLEDDKRNRVQQKALVRMCGFRAGVCV